MATPVYRMLGVSVHGIDLGGLKSLMDEAVARRTRWIIGNHNLHSVFLYHRDPDMRAFYDRSRYVFIDGMPLVVLGRLLGFPLTRRMRLTAVDWLGPVLAHAAERGWSVFFVGSTPAVADRASAILQQEFPQLRLWIRNGYFDAVKGSVDSEALIGEIARARPQLLIVGMGMPRQEKWIAENFEQLDANVVMNQGAFLDYVAGAASRPPRWLAGVGCEWLWRLAGEPRRLWRRYLVEPWFLLPHVISDVGRALSGAPASRSRPDDRTCPDPPGGAATPGAPKARRSPSTTGQV